MKHRLSIVAAILALSAPARAEESTPRAEESAPRAEESAPARAEESAPRAEESAPARAEESAPRAEESAPPRAPDASRSRGEKAQLGFSAGAAAGKFVGLPYRSLSLDAGARLPMRYVRWTGDLVVDLGQTERGLSLYRAAIGGGIENAGRVRLGVEGRLSYTMVLRATRDSAFTNALFGDIGGFGLGAQARLSIDVIRAAGWAVVVEARASCDVYNGGNAVAAGGLAGVYF